MKDIANEVRPEQDLCTGRTLGDCNMSIGLGFRQAVFFHGALGGITFVTT